MSSRIVVIGGGLAGLSAAIACMDAGMRVTLLEARPWLGGATWSTTRDGLTFDNGQHVFLRCCTEYRRFLDRLGVTDRVTLQSRLAVPVLAPGGNVAWLRRDALPRPLHLLPSLLRYTHLSWSERLHVARTARRIAALDLRDAQLDDVNAGTWLRAQGESKRAIEQFWDVLIRPTLNLPAQEASLALAAKVFQTGLLTEADAGDVGYATVPLARVHAEPALEVLQDGGATVRVGAPVDLIEASGPFTVSAAAERLHADAVILAVPHDVAARLLPLAAGIDPLRLRALGRSSIVNLHVVFDRRVTDHAFVAGVGSSLQWVFDRTEAVGLDRGQCLAVSLSAASAYLNQSVGELQRTFLPEFHALFPAAREAEVVRFCVTREPAATFRQRPGTRRCRPGATTAMRGLVLAGAWTDTGWPATMEGAVRSGLAAAEAALAHIGADGKLRAA